MAHITEPAPSMPRATQRRLEVFIGTWINQGHTIVSADAPSVEILTSDIYAYTC